MALEQRREPLPVLLLADRVLVGAGEQHARVRARGEHRRQRAQEILDALLGREARREADARAGPELQRATPSSSAATRCGSGRSTGGAMARSLFRWRDR